MPKKKVISIICAISILLTSVVFAPMTIAMVTASNAVFEFDTGSENWGVGIAAQASGLWDYDVPGSDGCLGFRFWSNDGGWINGPDNMGTDMDAAQNLRIRLKNAGPNDISSVSIYFTTTADTEWSEDKKITLPIDAASVNNDYKIYTADLSTVGSWTGTLKQLRFSLGTGERTVAESNLIYIDYIRIESDPLLSYTFDTGSEGWGVNVSGQCSGTWDCQVPGVDGSLGMQFWSNDGGWINGPDNINLTAASAVSARIRLKNAGPNDVDKIYLYFTTTEDTEFNDAKRLEFSIQKYSENSRYVEYTCKPEDVSAWSGTIKQLRITTGTGERTVAQSNWFYIDSIIFDGYSDKDVTLKSLSVTDYAFDNAAVFAPNVTDYTVTVPYEVASVTINAQANHASAQTEGVGTKALQVGENTFPIVVTNNGASKTYQVKVIRKDQVLVDDASLSKLSVNPGYVPFDADTLTYDITVPKGTTAISIYAEPNNDKATVTGTGENLAIANGASQDYEIVVTAEDGTTKKTYTIHVTVDSNYGFSFNDNTTQGWNIGVEPEPIGASIEKLTAENGSLKIELNSHYGWMTTGGLNWDTNDMKWLVIRVKNQTDVGNLIRVWFATDQSPNMYATEGNVNLQRVEFDIMYEEEYGGYWEYGIDMSKLGAWKGMLTELRFDVGRNGEGNPSGILWVDSITFQSDFTPAERPDPDADKNTTGVYDFDNNTAQGWIAPEENNGLGSLTAENGTLVAEFDGNGYLIADNLALNLNAGDHPILRIRLKNQASHADKISVRFATSLFPDMDDNNDGVYTQQIEAKVIASGDDFVDIDIDMSQNVRWMGILQALRIEFSGESSNSPVNGKLIFDKISLPVVSSGENLGQNTDNSDINSDNSQTNNNSAADTGVGFPLIAIGLIMLFSTGALLLFRKKSGCSQH